VNQEHPFEVGKNRIESLGDGMFAVAMTLLVLEVHVPNLPHDAPNVMLLPALIKLLPALGTYAVSFVSLGVFWVGHHNMYHAIRRADRVLLCLNILFFMVVCLLPFSTSLLDAFPQAQISPLIFGANLTVIGWMLFLQWLYANWRGDMFADHVTAAYRKIVRDRFLTYPLVATFTMLVCFWSIELSLAIYLALLPLYMIPGTVKETGNVTSPPLVPAEPKNSETKLGTIRPRAALWRSLHQATPMETQTKNNNKKILIGVGAAIFAIAAWAAFRPELLFVNKTVNESLPVAASSDSAKTPVSLASGKFHGIAHETNGEATVYQLPEGKRVLRFTNFMTSNGPDVHVYLVAAKDAADSATVKSAGFLDLGSIKGNQGDQNYDLPANADLKKYQSVSVWCARFGVNFASAPLMASATTLTSAPTVLEQGMFHGIAHETNGTAAVYRLPDSKQVLRFTNFATSNGPDVHVYLVAADDAKDSATVKSAGFLDLGTIKGNQGDQNYDLPTNVDLNKYRSVSIWCARFGVNFASAPLKKQTA
jgi:uncharacterized membrane protein